MSKQTKMPQQSREGKKTSPLDEANKIKQLKAEVGEAAVKPKDDSRKGYARTP